MAKRKNQPEKPADETVEPTPEAIDELAADDGDEAVDVTRRTAAEREELLAENRRNREQARADAAKKAAKRRTVTQDADGDDEVDVADDAEDRVPGRVETAPTRGISPVTILAALAGLLAVTTIVFGILAFRGGDSLGPDSGIGRDAVTDAKKYAVDIVTYSAGDYASLDKQIRDISTDDFAKRYIDASQQARKGNDAAKASSTAKALAAGLQSIDKHQAVVLVALDQKVTSPDLPSSGKDGIDYQSRVLVTLQRDGDRWVLSDLAPI
ncbi:MAG: hypothetical protein QM774_06340 [Gordonia sp. (in: high G+C Gram-positive bacteria)]|uniref:hypothetical protein n=1 Tax=Gordonia sp. (in: high G+C Gram-positive bacteria) TaxID=84139 RepID=UPI0039E4C206